VPALTLLMLTPPATSEMNRFWFDVFAVRKEASTSKNSGPAKPIVPAPVAVKLTVLPITSATRSLGVRLVKLPLLAVKLTVPVPALTFAIWSCVLFWLRRVIGSFVVEALTPATAGVVVNTSRSMPAAPSDWSVMTPPVTLVMPAPLPSRIAPWNEWIETGPVPAVTVAGVMSSPAPAA
jgi:hypothetical protein